MSSRNNGFVNTEDTYTAMEAAERCMMWPILNGHAGGGYPAYADANGSREVEFPLLYGRVREKEL